MIWTELPDFKHFQDWRFAFIILLHVVARINLIERTPNNRLKLGMQILDPAVYLLNRSILSIDHNQFIVDRIDDCPKIVTGVLGLVLSLNRQVGTFLDTGIQVSIESLDLTDRTFPLPTHGDKGACQRANFIPAVRFGVRSSIGVSRSPSAIRIAASVNS